MVAQAITSSWPMARAKQVPKILEVNILAAAEPMSRQRYSHIEKNLCAGHYELVPDRLVNGFPLWKLVGGARWLYSGATEGAWLVGGQLEEAIGFKSDEGFITNGEPHEGEMPSAFSAWFSDLKGEWVPNAGITVRAASLDTVSTLVQWRSTTKQYSEELPKDVEMGDDEYFNMKHLTRDGRFWKYIHEQVEKDSVQAALRPPPLLLVSIAEDRRRCSGFYQIVAGRLINGSPCWRLREKERRRGLPARKRWLYSGSDKATWLFSGPEAEAKGFTINKGYITSLCEHNGQMPDKVKTWYSEDCGGLKPDPTISVTVGDQKDFDEEQLKLEEPYSPRYPESPAGPSAELAEILDRRRNLSERDANEQPSLDKGDGLSENGLYQAVATGLLPDDVVAALLLQSSQPAQSGQKVKPLLERSSWPQSANTETTTEINLHWSKRPVTKPAPALKGGELSDAEVHKAMDTGLLPDEALATLLLQSSSNTDEVSEVLTMKGRGELDEVEIHNSIASGYLTIDAVATLLLQSS